MGPAPAHETAPETADHADGVWLTDRDPGELLGTRRVVVTLSDGDAIVLAELPTKQEAAELARETLAAIDRAVAASTWVELADRLVRPDAIESVDVEHVE